VLATRTSETNGEETKYTVMAIGNQEKAFEMGLKKFLKEAKILAGFAHENIVRVLDYFESHDTGYIVMEYVGQEDLAQLIKRQPEKQLTVAQALDILFPILDALKVIHANSIYHQDISLANVRMVDGKKPVLIDFGAARYVVGEISQSIEKVFKPGYSPIEQITGGGKMGPWTDIYACGAMFYAMIIGELPPQSIDRLERDDLIPPDQEIEISPSINDAILTALSVRIEDRFQTVEEFETALNIPTPTNHKKRWLAVARDALIVVVIMAVGITIFEYFRSNQKTPSVNDSDYDSEVSPQLSQIEQEELAQNLRECNGHFQAGRLTTGEGGTALTCYQAMLKKYPNNPHALTGIKNIEARYVEWIKLTLNEGRLNKAKQYLMRLRQVNPQSLQLAKLEAQVSALVSPRYLDNGDGTVTDNRNGLIWLKNANCFGDLVWDEATEIVAKLTHGQCGLHDESTAAGMWRLPTKDEWEAMIDKKYVDKQNAKQPTLSNTAGTGPWKEGDAFSGVQAYYYWSSTTDVNDPNNAWYVFLGNSDVSSGNKTFPNYVWPVRDK
jgi:serine/threonine protein kinase